MRRIGIVYDYNDQVEVHTKYFSVELNVSHGSESVTIDLDKHKAVELINLLEQAVKRL